MDDLFSALSRRLGQFWKPRRTPVTPRAYRCHCGRPVFFRNSLCLACGTPLGYDTHTRSCCRWRRAPSPACGRPSAHRPRPSTARVRPPALASTGAALNFDSPAGCNWLLAADRCPNRALQGLPTQPHDPRSRPIKDNRMLWQRIEVAKRRLVSSLLALGLPVRSKRQRGPGAGPGLRFPSLAARRAGGDDRPRAGHHHAQHRRGGRRAAGAHPHAAARALPDAARSSPP